MDRKTFWKALTPLGLLAAAGLIASANAVSAAEDDVVIGYFVAATGELAPYDSAPGAQCMVDIVNDNGGVLGGRKLKLITRDVKSDPALAGTAAQELIDEGAVVLLGPPTDGTLIPGAAMAQPHEIPVLSVGSTQPQFPLAMPENGYLVPYGDNMSASAAAQYAWKKGYKTAYLMVSHDIGSYSLVTPEFFADAFEHWGGKILGRMSYNAGLSDYSQQVTEFAHMDPKPDLIFSAFIVPDGGVFVRQLDSAGIDIPVMGTDGFDDPALIEVGGKGAELVTFTTHGFPSEGSKLKWFYDECTKRGFTVQNIFFGLAGESVEVVRYAIEQAGSAEPAAINATIKEIENMPGITTDSITFKDRGGIPLKRMAMVTVKDGKFALIEKIMPDYVAPPDLQPPE